MSEKAVRDRIEDNYGEGLTGWYGLPPFELSNKSMRNQHTLSYKKTATPFFRKK